ncbi:exodeoxyribonuclease V subunit gamma [Coralloluteibacterium stylophorae]|uniref:RecBCD enzyme subunit RecC n=1 Tax=Coralloluteibacterium stylophorae TaxID=1776034 RepID=A0A8J7VTE5_9GAMM|nr:exodeoxyribonuclease V subunit gamma [Coralloluteibacterium stylophorae]MBS7458455.1 exodeoxyribonuclease V subunit gamma [Coralloluteibacterium stylophorae]
MGAAQRGLIVYRASRLEALLDPLLALLDQAPPDAVLAPQTVIAAHPGMKAWLTGALARRRGPRGVVANLEIALPSRWLDDLARRVLGEAAVALEPYRRERLRWRVHDLLGRLDVPALAGYLDGADAPRRRMQLADRVAGLLSQYLVYRPDWLEAWRRGHDAVPEPNFLAPLWRALRADIGVAHRGERLRELVTALERGGDGADEAPLHVFGVSHLAPAELAVLRALARRRDVVLYLPDPCREHWAGLRDDRRALRALAQEAAFEPGTEARFLDQGHPLLARWGRMGQHFVLALDDGAAVDVRHWQDEAPPPPATRLERVQESIRRLVPELMAPGADADAERRDASLRVHACHTRLRELEALRDALLAALSDLPGLRPADIVVMAPDIGAYVPLLPAVFGEPGLHAGPLPYHLADVPLARAHPLFEAFRRLLALPGARVTAPEVVDLLAVPEVAARFGLGADEAEVVAGWLREARVAWALDADFRTRFEVPALEAHTFAWGLDRMLAGYAIGTEDEDPAIELADGSGLAPLAGVAGPQAALAGALDALLVELAAACSDAAAARPASEWAVRLERRMEGLFRVAPGDAAAEAAYAQLLAFVRALAAEPAASGLDPELEFGVVRELLLARLDGVPERQRFLMGGITVCGMVPQRAIPFRVVAVLGLDDGAFPRTGSDGGIDLMARHRRLGDRDVRSDDRYLFLETVMSARERLHLSYIGEGVRDGRPRNPAAPLAELMTALDAHAGLAPDAGTDRPWCVRHPLQPFDPRYFDGSDPRLFSFRADFSRMRPDPDAPAAPFYSPQPSGAGIDREGATAALREVQAWYRDPARQLLEKDLHLRLDALADDRLRDSEPLTPRFEALDGIGRRLFAEAMAHGGELPPTPPAWLRLGGVLPPGRLGAEAWKRECAQVAKVIGCARALGFADGLPQRLPQEVALEVEGVRIEGELGRLHVDGQGTRWVLESFPGRRAEKELTFRERVPAFLEWALARLAAPGDLAPLRIALLTQGGAREWQETLEAWDADYRARLGDTASTPMLEALRRRVARLLALRREGVWYFPKTSWAATAEAPDAAARAWAGSGFSTGERDHAPGYSALLAGRRAFAADAGDFAALAATGRELKALIGFDDEEAAAWAWA